MDKKSLNPLVSVIMPVFNSANYLDEAIQSVLQQTYQNFELIIVDDGSKDNSFLIALQYVKYDNRIKLFTRPDCYRKGGNACRNYGFKMARGKYINWFDSDDIMFSRMLEKKVEKLQDSLNDFVVCEGLEFIDTKKNIVKKWDKIESEQPLIDHAFGRINFHTNGPLFKFNFLRQTALFDEYLSRKQEWEFYTRLLLNSSSYGVIKEPLFYYRNHGESINGRNSNKTLRSRFRADFLVMRTLLESKREGREEVFIIKRHFVLKMFVKIKYTLKKKAFKNIIYGMYYLIRILDLNFCSTSLKKVLSKPGIIFNLMRLN